MAKDNEKNADPFQWEFVGTSAVTYAVEGEISDVVWNRFIAELRKNKTHRILSLGYGKSVMTATQRRAIADVLKEQGIEAVVVTDNSLTRGIVTAVSWLGAKVKAYGWNSLEEAVATIDAPDSAKAKMLEVARSFQKRAGTSK